MFEFLYNWADSLREYLLGKVRQMLIEVGPAAGLTISEGPRLECSSLYTPVEWSDTEELDSQELEL